MEKTRHKSLFFFALSAALVSTVFFTLLFATASFAFGWAISSWHFPLAVISAIGILFFRTRHYFKEAFAKTFSLLLGLYTITIFIAIVVALSFFDISYNGQAYHQETIIQLKEGWSPFHHPSSPSLAHAERVNQYPKGAEIPQAAMYAFFGKIEVGKATNIILMFASFFLGLALMLRIPRLTPWKSVLIAAIAALNPIVIVQLMTFYVDGQLASLLLLLILALVLLYFEFDKWFLGLFFKIVVLALNIKFAAVLFVPILILSFLILLHLEHRRANFRRFFISALLALYTGLCVVGYNPYITNTIAYKDPFFPQAGINRTDVREWHRPAGIEKLDRVRALLISTFAHTSDSDESPRLKTPFFVSGEELNHMGLPDTRVAAFGAFFSGILLLSTILFVLTYTIYRRKKASTYTLWLLVTLLLSILVIPDPWWARHIPQLWLVPLIMLIYIEVHSNNKTIKALKHITHFAILANIGLIILITTSLNLRYSQELRKQLGILQERSKTVQVDFGAYLANRARFDEYQIPIQQISSEAADRRKVYYMQCVLPQVRVDASTLPELFDQQLALPFYTTP